MSGTENIIAGTAFEIVARSFASGDEADRNSFRLKNLTRNEALKFVRVWQARSAERSLKRVRLLVASDSHEDFPAEFRANPEHAITFYRNNNEHGLVYIETKVESDEQGLKNLFTLRDVNFLDGTFDEAGEFVVPEEMVRQALQFVGAPNPEVNELLRDRLVEVLRELNAAGMTIPVRKYAGFVLAAAQEVLSGPGVYAPEETNALVGRCLVQLDMFPDEEWRMNATRVARRLSLNRLRAELAASPSSDLDPEKTAQDCHRTKFVDELGEQYDPDTQAYWREECSQYCLDPTDTRRGRIPYRIFEQVFSKDVKGLPLGQRVAEEILDSAPSRKSEFDGLAVETGLNNRSVEDARKFLESEPAETSDLPLRDLLSKQTLRMVEKLASPAIDRIQNPLIKLSQVASDFRARTDLDDGEYRIELRAGPAIGAQHESTLGLFAFLYGSALAEICASLKDGLGSVSLEVDGRLTGQTPVPALRGDMDPDADSSDSSSTEEDEGTVWLPVPLEFVLVNLEDGEEVDSEVAVEWLPDDLSYLALFWISVCGEDRGEVTSELYAPANRSGEDWITEVAHRMLPFQNGRSKPIPDALLKTPIIHRLVEIRSGFRAEAEKEGLSSRLLNDVFDAWSVLLADARRAFVPDGEIPEGMIEFLNADCVQEFDGDRVLMLQSHPLKLRWIASYLAQSMKLALDAIEGSLRLNEQNENLYLDWIKGLSPHQQPSIHSSADGHILFADGERGWTENFQRAASSGGTASGDRIHSSLVSEIARQTTAYLHAHPYKSDGLRILIVTGGASALAADIVQEVRKGEFKNLAMTIELVAPKSCWDEAARQFELVDTDNRLAGAGALFPPVQLNLHDLERVREDAEAALGGLICDIAVVPQFLDDNISTDAKTEDESASLGRFDPLLDDPTYIASGAGASALWVSLRPKMPDTALSDWSTLAVRHERRTPVAADRPEATDFMDIRINFNNTARFFGALHKRSHWVITVERHITREQIERLETRPEVLSLRDGVGPGGLFTLIVSSNAGQQFVIDRLTRKLKRIASLIGRENLAEQRARELAQKIYEEARQISPRLTLDALGISRVTEEILGLSIARQVADRQMPISVEDGFIAWISLDEHPEWFASGSSIRADMIRLAVSLGDEGLSVDVLVLESKLRRSGYDAHGAEQVRKTLQMFDAVFPTDQDSDPMDGQLWRNAILSAIDTVSKKAVFIPREATTDSAPRRSRVPEEIRSLFRDGEFASVKISGLYSICEYSHPRELTAQAYDADPRVQIVQTGGSALLDRSDDTFVLVPANPVKPAEPEDNRPVELAEPDVEVEAAQDGVEPTPKLQAPPESETGETGNDDAPEVDPMPPSTPQHLPKSELDRRYQVILDTLGQYGVNVNRTDAGVDYVIEGPASILFRVRPGRGVAPGKIAAHHDALKLALELDASQDIRFDIDKGYVTIDVPKLDEDRYFVDAEDLWARWQRPETGLKVPLGEDRFGNVVEIDFTSSNSPHLLIGGTTGSGKSEALNTILAGITEHYAPDDVRLQLIDPKGTELEHLSESHHLDGEIGWDEEDAIEILARAVDEMQARYAMFKNSKVRALGDYNAKVSEEERIPRWVIVLDEYADLTSEPDAKKTIEAHLKRLAQKARAAGIHVIIATQKPDASVISTNLRSNLPAQLALRVKSATESRVIMDDAGAESLTGKGDAFFKESGVLTRVQCAKI
ncbi:FtsK/SpoIIIE family protein [Roseovarius litoreus]|uniref:FtsK/SpoIIIE family protein n=1 Tax=Roseovarius litoreus TaxID=1155722 RepID=A0A1M7CUL5_9RHOB|nr:DNA translocase FtsK [Roseovarius litoreus]SHL70783.1 FtsK/SpoIIIE family protein [Roseovarius litoreus]